MRLLAGGRYLTGCCHGPGAGAAVSKSLQTVMITDCDWFLLPGAGGAAGSLFHDQGYISSALVGWGW